MRIMAGGFEHETNTFSNLRVTGEMVAAVRQEGQELLDMGTTDVELFKYYGD